MPTSIFHFFPPAREEWRAFAVQCGGSLLAVVVALCVAQVRSNSTVLCGVALGIFYLLARSGTDLWRKARRARGFAIELRPDALVLHEGARETVIAWKTVKKCDAIETSVRVLWRDGETEREWRFSPREVIDGQTLAREIKQRSTPNFIALDAK